MAGETDLATLIRTMRPVLGDEVYVFVAIPHGSAVPSGVTPQMTFREAEGLTLILPKHEAEAAGLAGAFPCRMITLDVHSSLESVGFLAAVSARLAAAGIPCNPVSAFHHDHIFVPIDRAEEAVRILDAVSRADMPTGHSSTAGGQASLPAFRLRLEPLTAEAAKLGFKWAAPEIGTRHKFGGEPDLLRFDAWPACGVCRNRMTFVAQIDSVGDDLAFADVGMIYVFYCFDCNEADAITQSG